MNSIELKNHLLKMFLDAIQNGTTTIQNVHACFYMAVIDKIMEYYMTKANYYEEHAIATFDLFLKKGILKF